MDTSFIISAIKNKIDIFSELLGERIIIPSQVISELERVNQDNAKLALEILKVNDYEEIDLGKGHVDKLIIRFAKENPKTIVATLDREIKKKVKNLKLVIRGKKKIEIV